MAIPWEFIHAGNPLHFMGVHGLSPTATSFIATLDGIAMKISHGYTMGTPMVLPWNCHRRAMAVLTLHMAPTPTLNRWQYVLVVHHRAVIARAMARAMTLPRHCMSCNDSAMPTPLPNAMKTSSQMYRCSVGNDSPEHPQRPRD